jgi:hypothetical protein
VAEGETITLLGGVAAHQGLLKFPAGGGCRGTGWHDWRSAALFSGAALRASPAATIFKTPQENPPRPATHSASSVPVCDWHALYVRLSYYRADLIGASRLPPKIFLPLNILGAIAWALIFTTLGYLGGEVIGPWLHNLDQHVKHWAWLILVVGAVIAVRIWLKRRDDKRE